MSDELYNELMLDFEAADEASGQLQQFTNAGKYQVDVQRIHWDNRVPIEVDSETYRKLPANQKQMNIVFSVDIQEFKPDLDFTYKRTFKYRGKDWYDIVEPSVAKVFGLSQTREELTKAVVKVLFENSGKYAFVADVPNKGGKTSSQGNVLKVPALNQVFSSREEFFVAAKSRFGDSFGGGASSTTASNKTFSDQIINGAKMLNDLGKPVSEIASSLDISENDVNQILGG